MKIRNGFVSNSSSSSFIAVGVRGTEEIKQRVMNLNVDLEDYFDCDDVIYDDSVYGIIGTEIASVDDCGYINEDEISFEEIENLTKELSEKYQIPKSEFKIIMGTYLC